MELRGSSGRNRARGFDCHPSVSEYVQLYLYDMKESVTSSTAITYCITSSVQLYVVQLYREWSVRRSCLLCLMVSVWGAIQLPVNMIDLGGI